MLLDRVAGQPFDALVDHANGWRGRVCKAAALAVTGILTVLVPFACANPPDPTWVAGIYDDADHDDVALAVTSADSAPDAPGVTLLVTSPSSVYLGAATETAPPVLPDSFTSGRAPPVE